MPNVGTRTGHTPSVNTHGNEVKPPEIKGELLLIVIVGVAKAILETYPLGWIVSVLLVVLVFSFAWKKWIAAWIGNTPSWVRRLTHCILVLALLLSPWLLFEKQ